MAAQFDYDILFFNAEGEKMGGNTYKKLVALLGIGGEIIDGKPLSEGGVPQALSVARSVGVVLNAASFKIYYNGGQIA